MSDKIAEPKIEGVYEFIVGKGGARGFYIPPYQRKFSWGKSDIERLFEDINEGINQILIADSRDASDAIISFIGTIVCYDDDRHTTIDPKFEDDLPETVYVLIDGQQRVTVMIMMAVVLHDYLHDLSDKISSNIPLKNKLLDAMHKLLEMVEIKLSTGEYRYYPRIIRAFDDRWAKSKSWILYKSPVSQVLYQYGRFHRDGDKDAVSSKGKINPKLKIEDNDKKSYASLKIAILEIKKNVINLCETSGGNHIDLSKTKNNKDVLNPFIRTTKDIFSPDNGLECECVRALTLSEYYMNRVQFVQLVTTDEDYAFNIFDSLNTTGQALTAYETFKPMVVKFEGLNKFNESESGKHTQGIEEYLDGLEKKEDRDRKTSNLLISFILAERGERLSQKTFYQRKDMNSAYKNLDDDDKRNFTKHLKSVSEVYRYLWEDKKDEYSAQKIFGDDDDILGKEFSQAQFCLNLLSNANHTISAALISRFYHEIKAPLNISKEERKKRAIALCQLIKSTAAFFAVWRSSRKDTSGIEKIYVEIINGSLESKHGKLKEQAIIKRNGGSDFSLAKVQEAFCYALKVERSNQHITIDSKKEWIKHVQKMPIYSGGQQHIAKFIIFLASHCAMPDDANPGNLKDARNNHDFIRADVWGDESYATVEHIIPQKSKNLKREDLDREDLDRIGNLTLLPREVNASINNLEWDEGKREIYKMLSSESLEGFDIWAKTISENFPKIERSYIKGLRKEREMPMTKAVSLCDDFSSRDCITSRGQNILERAWVHLSGWLDFKNFNFD